jgi:hypothetical protein
MGYSQHIAYPPHAPQLWIKYGRIVLPDEVTSQMMAYRGLQQLQSSVRIPKVYYTCKYKWVTYIVMEYIPGKTMEQLLEELPSKKQDICNLVAFGLQELLRIPVPPNARPAAINGGRIWHPLFDECRAPLEYQNVSELEAHLNEVIIPVCSLYTQLTMHYSGSVSLGSPHSPKISPLSRWSTVMEMYGLEILSSTWTNVVLLSSTSGSAAFSHLASQSLPSEQAETILV